MVNSTFETRLLMVSRHNMVIDLGDSDSAIEILDTLMKGSRGKGEGRIKCTVTKHRLAKTAIMLGIKILSRQPPASIQRLAEKLAPLRKPGRPARGAKRRLRTELVLECSSTQGLLDGLDTVWRIIATGEVSHRRIAKTALCLGLDSMAKVDHGKVRQLVSRVCPVPKKYWDTEVGAWL